MAYQATNDPCNPNCDERRVLKSKPMVHIFARRCYLDLCYDKNEFSSLQNSVVNVVDRLNLTQLNLTQPDSIWFNHTQLDSIRLNLTQADLTRLIQTQLDSTRLNQTQPNSNQLNLIQLDSTRFIKTQPDKIRVKQTQPKSTTQLESTRLTPASFWKSLTVI